MQVVTSIGPIFTKFYKSAAHIGAHDQLDLVSWLLKGRCYGNRFLARTSENGHTPPSICAMAFHNDRTIATWMRALTPPTVPLRLIKIRRTLVQQQPPNVAGAFARAGRATRWAFPRISS